MRRGMEFLTLLLLMVMVLVVGTPAMASATDGWQIGAGAFFPTGKMAASQTMYGADGWDPGWKVSLDLNTEKPFALVGPFAFDHAQLSYTSFHNGSVSASLPMVVIGGRLDCQRLHFYLDGGVGRPREGDEASINWAWQAGVSYELTEDWNLAFEHQASQPVRGHALMVKRNLPL